ncbi:MAG: T9SS type A sorting domain-containing protein [Bacteroidota bacterium]
MKRFALLMAAVIGIHLTHAQTISYSSHVRPLFESYGCLGCHGGTNGLFLDTYASVFSTGNHAPVVVPGDTNSVIVLKLKGTTFGDRMPFGAGPMAPGDLNTIISWIKNGAVENPTSVRELQESGLIKTFELHQNYPNPFNPVTQIRFAIPVSGSVRMTLIDAAGKQIAILIDREMKRGSYSYTLDASRLSSGVYFYRLQSANYSVTKKLVLTK